MCKILRVGGPHKRGHSQKMKICLFFVRFNDAAAAQRFSKNPSWLQERQDTGRVVVKTKVGMSLKCFQGVQKARSSGFRLFVVFVLDVSVKKGINHDSCRGSPSWCQNLPR